METKRNNRANYKRTIRRTRLIYIKSILFASALIAALAALTIITYAAEPGSTADPIALKSYVDSKLDALETKLTAMLQNAARTPQDTTAQSSATVDNAALASRLSELETAVALLKNENETLRQNMRQISELSGTGSELVSNSGRSLYSDNFNAVEISASQRIIFGAGAEMVLRTGKASAIRGELGALVDLITGRDLDAGESVPLNHLILSPRNDNRGVRISEDAWILIKGPYELR